MEKYPKHKRPVKEVVARERKLSVELGSFVNQWVAIFDSEVVGSAMTLKELLEDPNISARNENKGLDAVMQVDENLGGANFFFAKAA